MTVNLSVNSIWDRICRMKHPLLFLLIVGLAIRLLITTVVVQYDADYWARVIRNLRVDEGLYNMEGFYYTPVWGYLLSFINVLQCAFLDLGEYGVRVTEAIFVEYVPTFYMSANIPSLAFNYSVRIPLIIADVLLSLAVYWLIKDITEDEKKSLMAFLLTFMSVHLAGCTCMTGMPDTFTALFMILTIIFMRRESNLLAGVMFALSALTKFFPVFLLFILCAYILNRYRGCGNKGLVELSKAIGGAAVTSILVYLPILMEGNAARSLAFIMDRASDIGEMVSEHALVLAIGGVAIIAMIVIYSLYRVRSGRHIFNLGMLSYLTILAPVVIMIGGVFLGGMDGLFGTARIALYLAAILLSLILGITMYRSKDRISDEKLIWNCCLIIGFCMLYPPAPQYVVTLVPLIACYLAMKGTGLIPWVLLAIAGIMFIPVTNGLMLMTLAEWTSLISLDTAVAIMEFYQTSVGGLSIMMIQYILGGALQYIALLMVFVSLLRDESIKGLINTVTSRTKHA
jgi:hypothetical protein